MSFEDVIPVEVPIAPENIGPCRALAPDKMGMTPCGNTHKTYTHWYKLWYGDTDSFAISSSKNLIKPTLTKVVPPNAPPITCDSLHTVAPDEDNYPHGTSMYSCASCTSVEVRNTNVGSHAPMAMAFDECGVPAMVVKETIYPIDTVNATLSNSDLI